MAIEVTKPTTTTEDVGVNWTNIANSYDTTTGGDETTNAYTYNSSGGTMRWHTWQTPAQTYTSLTLNVKWSTNGGYSDDTFSIQYTLNAGGVWNTMLANGVHNEVTIQTAQVSIPSDQSMSQVQVRYVHVKTGGGDKAYTYIYDVWANGTYSEVVKHRIFHIM